MNNTTFLETLKEFTEETTKNLLMPVRRQKADTEDPADRAPTVFMMRVPDMNTAFKKAPYILHQILMTSDVQKTGERPSSKITIRSVFCVYNEDSQEGGLMLLNLVERLRIAMLEQREIGGQYRLDASTEIETAYYTDDTAPYFGAEMVSDWFVPPINQEVNLL